MGKCLSVREIRQSSKKNPSVPQQEKEKKGGFKPGTNDVLGKRKKATRKELLKGKV